MNGLAWADGYRDLMALYSGDLDETRGSLFCRGAMLSGLPGQAAIADVADHHALWPR